MNDKDNLPPLPSVSLPPLPVEDEAICHQSESIKELEDSEKDYIAPIEDPSECFPSIEIPVKELEEDEALTLSEILEDFPVEESHVGEEVFSDAKVKSVEFRPRFSLSLFSCSIILIVFLSVAWFSVGKDKEYIFRGLDESSVFSLKESITRDKSRGISLSLKKVSGKEIFYLGTNFGLDGKAHIRLSSVSGKILGHSPVTFSMSAPLKNGAAKFSTIIMEKGLRVVPGEYNYIVSFIPSGHKARIQDKLRGFGISIFDLETRKNNFKGKDIFYGRGERAFLKKLKLFKEQTNKKIIAPLEERLGRYETFMQLLRKTHEHFELTLKESKKVKEMSRFEDLYNKDVGPFLTDLITDSNRLHLSYLNVDPERSREYEKLLIMGKRIGGVASDMATEGKKLKKFDQESIDRISNRFKTIVDTINDQIISEKLIIDKELSRYKFE